MSILLCSECDRPFDINEQVEAQYEPPVCEDCICEREQQILDQDNQAIEEMTNGHD